MPTLSARQLTTLSKSILMAAGTPDDIAECVGRSLATSDLRGVESHGVVRLEWYLEQIRDHSIIPDARPSTQTETATTATLKGNGAFGIYGMQRAAELAVSKAKANHLAAVALTDVGHTGQIGQFAEAVAVHGMFGMVLGGGNHERWGVVVPHGGMRPFLPTNPYAFALPAGKHGAVVVDFATCAVATGRLRLHRATGKPVPIGWIIDREGRPSTNVEDFFQGGAQLPAAGQKGYGLAVLAEIIAEALLGKPREFNWLIIALDLGVFRPMDEFVGSCEELLDDLKSVPPAPGFKEVLIPGEPERQTERARSQNGIDVPDEVWQPLQRAARSVNLDVDGILAAAAGEN